MKAQAHAALTLLSVLGLVGCSHGSMMNNGGASMHQAVTDAEVENDRHRGACERAASMPAMLSELDQHETSMGPIMNRMDDALGGMGDCSGGNFNDLSGTMTQMQSAMSAHDQRMRGADTLDAARTECSSHADSMAGMMQNMMSDLGGMSCSGMYP